MFSNKRFFAVTLVFPVAIATVSVIWLVRQQMYGVGNRVFKGKTLATWFDQMQGYNGDPGVQIMREIGSDAVVFLAERINLKDSVLRAKYVSIWPKLAPELRSKLSKPKSAAQIRMQAIGTLRAMGTPFTTSRFGLATLTAALSNPDFQVRSRAAGAIGDIGPQAASAVPALLKSVEQRSPIERGVININGIWALGQIGPEARSAIPLLNTLVTEYTGRERVYAAVALLKVGGDSAMAIAALEEAVKEVDKLVRTEAARALENVTPVVKTPVKESMFKESMLKLSL